MTAAYTADTYEGRPCKKGGHRLRYVSNQHCVECERLGKERRTRNLEKRAENRLLARTQPKAKASILYRSMKHRARVKGLEFSLSLEWIEERIDAGVCEISGLPFQMPKGAGRGWRSPYTPSIDRIDVSRGYSPDNCRLILWGLNMAFAQWGEQTFAPIAQAWLNKRN